MRLFIRFFDIKYSILSHFQIYFYPIKVDLTKHVSQPAYHFYPINFALLSHTEFWHLFYLLISMTLFGSYHGLASPLWLHSFRSLTFITKQRPSVKNRWRLMWVNVKVRLYMSCCLLVDDPFSQICKDNVHHVWLHKIELEISISQGCTFAPSPETMGLLVSWNPFIQPRWHFFCHLY